MTIKTIYHYIAFDGKEFDNELSCIDYEKALKKKEKALKEKEKVERQKAEDDFFKRIGATREEIRTRNIYIIVDRLGRFKEVSRLPYDEMIRNNIKNDTFGHNLCSFVDRSKEWYSMPLIDMFENLDWTTVTIDEKKILCDIWGNARRRMYQYEDNNGNIKEFIAHNKKDAKEIAAIAGVRLVG